MAKNHDEDVSNPTADRPFTDILETRVSRRQVLTGGLALATTSFFGGAAGAFAPSGKGKHGPLLNFQPVSVAKGTGPIPSISPDYEIQVIIPWGDPLEPGGPAYVQVDPNNPGASDFADLAVRQTRQFGIGHDGMTYFPIDGRKGADDDDHDDDDDREHRRRGRRGNGHGLLAINHEFGDNDQVIGVPQGQLPVTLDQVRRSQHAHGVSIVELRRKRGKWQTVKSKYARRVHVNSPVTFSGPAANSPLLDTPNGNVPLGTVNNCSNGETPWGTYLTCEENFNGYFGATNREQAWIPTKAQQRYGFSRNGFGYGWHTVDRRFDLSDPDYVNEENRFGWVVEIDPFEPTQVPVKRTAMGRLKHEGATITVGRGGRVVAYMGDDQRFDYIYKFVSEDNWKSMRARGLSPLDHGTLYVARFNEDGTGEWLPLTIDNPALAGAFAHQAEIVTFARLAADRVGATPMDRPEWSSVAPDDQVYFALTNNTRRTGADAANPLAPNPDGHIIRFRDADEHTGVTFEWGIFILAKDTRDTEDAFTDPDGLFADPDGRLFILTDGGQPDGLNNQMLVADTATGELRRLFAGVTGDEVTGITMTPNRRTAFVNLQHPGDNGNPNLTNFPVMNAVPDGVTVPRDATVVITRKDGGIIGS